MTEEELEFGTIYPLMNNPSDTTRRKEGVKKLRKLAETGFAPAIFALGMAYFDGRGVRRDYKMAFDLISQAAEQNYPTAVGFMGIFYATASPRYGVVEHDPVEAVKWYERAAREGNDGAQYNLAVAYRIGLGLSQSYRQAYIWASLAVQCSSIPFTAAKAEREQALQHLSEDERQAADLEIKELGCGLPHERSEHSSYWRQCAQAGGVRPG